MQTKKAIVLTLKLLGVAGLAGVTIVAPNAMQALDIFLRKSSKSKIPNHKKLLNELRRQGLVHISQFDDEVSFTLTPAGIHRLQQSIVNELEIPRPKQWDKKWRVVTYDIPVRQSRQRQNFTSHLQNLGFFMLQRSLWIHPFPCFEQVEQLAGHYNVLRYCSLFEISKLKSHCQKAGLERMEVTSEGILVSFYENKFQAPER